MVIEYRIVYLTADSYKHIETDGLSPKDGTMVDT